MATMWSNFASEETFRLFITAVPPLMAPSTNNNDAKIEKALYALKIMTEYNNNNHFTNSFCQQQ